MVAPAAALCGGGAVLGGIGGFLHGREVNDGEYKMLRKRSRELEAQLVEKKLNVK